MKAIALVSLFGFPQFSANKTALGLKGLDLFLEQRVLRDLCLEPVLFPVRFPLWRSSPIPFPESMMPPGTILE